jgi:hypothetical protein
VAGLQTQFSFTLPKGYVDDAGVLHRHGTMRLATARDEIEPLRSREIEGPDDPFLTVLVLARVITELGTLDEIGVAEVERLFAADLAFLQDLYGIINFGDPRDVAALQASVAPDIADMVDDPSAAMEPGEAADGDEPDVGDPSTDPAPASARARARIEEVARPAGS